MRANGRLSKARAGSYVAFNYLDIALLPRLFDIVWCRFPERKDPQEPAFKVRPALVRSSAIDPRRRIGLLEVAYGTTNLKIDRRRYLDLIIMNSAEVDRLGLQKATRFDLDNVVRIPWCSEYFCPPAGQMQTIMGRLDDGAKDRLQRLRALREQFDELRGESEA